MINVPQTTNKVDTNTELKFVAPAIANNINDESGEEQCDCYKYPGKKCSTCK